MELNIYPEDHPLKEDFESILQTAINKELMEPEAVCSVSFIGPEEIHELNAKWRGIDRPTDVLSFAVNDDLDELTEDLGDIFINTQAVEDQAAEYGHSPHREACFLFAHGLLHLLGYDHQSDEDEKVMRDLQHTLLDEVAPR